MGDFTKHLLGGNGAKAVPIGSTHYEMAEVSFYLDRTPKEILGQVVQGIVTQLQQAGQYEQANAMIKNPQPFYGNPGALAVFMACSLELEKRDKRIAKLEQALGEIAERLSSDDSFLGAVLSEALGGLQSEAP